MTCTVECWTPQECAACRMRISPSGRAVSVNSCCISAALGDVTQVRLVSGWQEVTE